MASKSQTEISNKSLENVSDSQIEKTPEPMKQEDIKVPDAPKKRGRKPKIIDDDTPKVRKPRNKKVAENTKNDNAENENDVKPKPKKERKPRAKTEYNIFIGEKMKELREKHKNDTDKLKTTEYMKMAIAEWKLHKEAKANA